MARVSSLVQLARVSSRVQLERVSSRVQPQLERVSARVEEKVEEDAQCRPLEVKRIHGLVRVDRMGSAQRMFFIVDVKILMTKG